MNRRLPFSLAAGAVLALTLAVPALAHAELVSSDPPDKAVLATPPATITLTFSEGLDAGKSSFKVIGPAGTIGTGKADKDGATVMTLDGLALDPGDYTIEWTSAAEDGHIDRGKLAFTVSQPTPPPASQPAAPSASAAPSAPASAAASAEPTAVPILATPVPVPSAAPSAPAAASSSDVLLPIVIALVAVGVMGVLVLRRSRRA